MSLDTATVDHLCNVIRRQVLEEFPALTLFYIVYKPGQAMKALQAKKEELKKHPAGRLLIPCLEKIAAKDPEIDDFCGLAIGREKKLLAFMGKEQTMAAFFINQELFDNAEDAREQAWAMAWDALYIMEEFKTGNPQSFQIKEGVITAERSEEAQLYHNMLGDIMATIVLELTGHPGSIQKLARHRSLMALTPSNTILKIENYPFLLAYDATQVVFKDLNEAALKIKPVHLALQLTHEIGLTFDESSMQQWQSFCSAAQEMAWMGADKNRILSTAVYSSEDPYVRATAHIVAEALNIEPVIMMDADIFNPFADQELSERYHLKSSEAHFQESLAQAIAEGSPMPFIKAAHVQNEKLVHGQPLGWSAYGLIRAADAFESAQQKKRDIKTDATEAYYQGFRETPWRIIREMNRILTDLRRQRQPINAQTIIDVARNDETLFAFAHAFSISQAEKPIPNEAPPLETRQPVVKEETPTPAEEKKDDLAELASGLSWEDD